MSPACVYERESQNVQAIVTGASFFTRVSADMHVFHIHEQQLKSGSLFRAQVHVIYGVLA